MVQVIKKGLETSVQDYPGRIGTLNLGFPPSGPMDSWSFRLANVLVENEPGAAALECQFLGPTLKFNSDRIIAITGANMSPKINGTPVPLWESLEVKKDQVLEMFDEKFLRMWEFYLTSCEMAFKWGDQVVYQFQLAKNYRSTPVTRDYIYQ